MKLLDHDHGFGHRDKLSPRKPGKHRENPLFQRTYSVSSRPPWEHSLELALTISKIAATIREGPRIVKPRGGRKPFSGFLTPAGNPIKWIIRGLPLN